MKHDVYYFFLFYDENGCVWMGDGRCWSRCLIMSVFFQNNVKLEIIGNICLAFLTLSETDNNNATQHYISLRAMKIYMGSQNL